MMGGAGGDAYDTIERFGKLHDSGDDTSLVELFAGDHTAWAQRELVAPDGVRSGLGVYRVRDGHLTYHRDHLNG